MRIKDPDNLLHECRVRLFGSVADGIYYVSGSKETDPSVGKTFCGCTCPKCWQLKHKICPALERHTASAVFICDRRNAAFQEVTAHDYDNVIGTGLFADLFDLILVSVVKRIVFGDDSCNFHRVLLLASRLVHMIP